MLSDIVQDKNSTTLGPYSFNIFVQCVWSAEKVGANPKGLRVTEYVLHAGCKHPCCSEIQSSIKKAKVRKSLLLCDDDDSNKKNGEAIQMNGDTGHVLRSRKLGNQVIPL